MSENVAPVSATQMLEKLLAMPEIAVSGGVAIPSDLARDVLIESGIDPAQLVADALCADMSVAEIKTRMARG